MPGSWGMVYPMTQNNKAKGKNNYACMYFPVAKMNDIYIEVLHGGAKIWICFEWRKQYFTNDLSEWVKCCFHHEKRKFISRSHCVITGQCRRLFILGGSRWWLVGSVHVTFSRYLGKAYMKYCPLSSPKRVECLHVCFRCLSGVVIVTLNHSCRIRMYTSDAGDHGELFWSSFCWLRWFSLCTHWGQVYWHNASLVFFLSYRQALACHFQLHRSEKWSHRYLR